METFIDYDHTTGEENKWEFIWDEETLDKFYAMFNSFCEVVNPLYKAWATAFFSLAREKDRTRLTAPRKENTEYLEYTFDGIDIDFHAIFSRWTYDETFKNDISIYSLFDKPYIEKMLEEANILKVENDNRINALEEAKNKESAKIKEQKDREEYERLKTKYESS